MVKVHSSLWFSKIGYVKSIVYTCLVLQAFLNLNRQTTFCV